MGYILKVGFITWVLTKTYLPFTKDYVAFEIYDGYDDDLSDAYSRDEITH
jgi:hypothetical protein